MIGLFVRVTRAYDDVDEDIAIMHIESIAPVESQHLGEPAANAQVYLASGRTILTLTSREDILKRIAAEADAQAALAMAS